MQNENIKNLEPVVEIKNSNQIQEPLTDTTLPTQPQKQRAYSSTNIPLEFEPDDDIDAIMERFNNLSDEEQIQTKREICEYYIAINNYELAIMEAKRANPYNNEHIKKEMIGLKNA